MKRYTADVRNVSKLVIVIMLVTTVISLSITCLTLRSVVTRNDEQMLKVLASKTFDALNVELRRPLSVALTIASDSFLIQNLKLENPTPSEGELKSMQNYLDGIRRRFGYATAYVVSDASKNYYTQGGIAKILDPTKDTRDAWYKRFADSKVEYMLKINVDEIKKNSWMLFVDARIEDSDETMLGVCGVSVGLQNLQKTLKTLEQTDGIRITLVDKDGNLQLNNESLNLDTAALMKLIGDQPSEEFALKKLNGSRLIVKHIPELDWYLVVQRDEVNLMNTFLNAVLYTGGAFFATLLILLILIRLSVSAAQR